MHMSWHDVTRLPASVYRAAVEMLVKDQKAASPKTKK